MVSFLFMKLEKPNFPALFNNLIKLILKAIFSISYLENYLGQLEDLHCVLCISG